MKIIITDAWNVMVEKPNGTTDHAMVYSSGKIAFSGFYLEDDYLRLCQQVKQALVRKAKPLCIEQKGRLPVKGHEFCVFAWHGPLNKESGQRAIKEVWLHNCGHNKYEVIYEYQIVAGEPAVAVGENVAERPAASDGAVADPAGS